MRLGLTLWLCGALAGCGGWHGDTYLRHRAPPKRARKEASFRFVPPPAQRWTPVHRVKDVQVAWMNADIGGIITIHAQCDEQGDSSLAQYTDHLGMDWTDWHVLRQTPGRLIGRAALWSEVRARLDGVERQNLLVVVKHSGCLFDLIYSARPGQFAEGRPDFERVVAGFVYPLEAS